MTARAPVEVGQLIRVRCEGFAHRGRAVARLEGLVVFVFGALPGEEVSARVTKVERHQLFADSVDVHSAAPGRVEPRCPHFGSCGGCQLQHAGYPLQLSLKEDVLRQALLRARVEWPEDAQVVGSRRPWGYRWRGELHTVSGRSGLGFKRRGSYAVEVVGECPIHHPAIEAMIRPLTAASPAGSPRYQTLHLTVGEEGEELLLSSRPDPAVGQEIAERLPEQQGLPRVTMLSTEQRYRERTFRVHPESFIQVNQSSLEELYEPLIQLVGGASLAGKVVVDAYGGTGILSQRLADQGARVILIESSQLSARLGQVHSEMYGERVEVRRGEVEEELPLCPAPDLVVVDPPRAGLAAQVTGWLSLAGPPVIAYLSCEVSTLARDLHALCNLGPYRLDSVRLVDMFPQTYHFETLALLRRC